MNEIKLFLGKCWFFRKKKNRQNPKSNHKQTFVSSQCRNLRAKREKAKILSLLGHKLSFLDKSNPERLFFFLSAAVSSDVSKTTSTTSTWSLVFILGRIPLIWHMESVFSFCEKNHCLCAVVKVQGLLSPLQCSAKFLFQ